MLLCALLVFGMVECVHDHRDEQRVDHANAEKHERIKVKLARQVVSLGEIVESVIYHVAKHQRVKSCQTSRGR